MNTHELKSKKCSNRSGFGFLLIIAGLVLLGGKLGYIPDHIYDVILSWPMIFVVIAAVNYAKREFATGTIFLAIGAFFLLPDLFPGYSPGEIYKFWPVLLILGGILFLFRRKNHIHTSGIKVDDHDVIDELAIFGGGTTNVDSKNFRGGKITCVFGGGEINFANSKMSDKGAVIDLVAVFGGANIMVPMDWNVKVEMVSVFGGFADKRIYQSETGQNNKTLLIKGVAIFGGGELRNI